MSEANGDLVVPVTEAERKYLVRAIDIARGFNSAAQFLDPVGRDELLKKFGGRFDEDEPV